MKKVKIVRVAEWDGWCGACAADRPLVLTRTGRLRLRTWLTGEADDSRPLTLTCRLCGTGVGVPLERDDPPVVVAVESHPRTAAAGKPEILPTEVGEAAPDVPALPAVPAQATPSAAELTAGRQAVAQAVRGLLAQRSTATTLAQPAPAPVVAPVAFPVLPLQRTASSGGLAELQLLADGIDLLSSGRA